MCGIVGGVAKRNLRNILLEGLHRLEYRGYDSAGLAIVNRELAEPLQTFKVVGKVNKLSDTVNSKKPKGRLGIAHTRWATHGGVTEKNAHPHVAANRFALVHNGIISNFAELKHKLEKRGYKFQSDTDSEVIVALLSAYYSKTKDFLKALRLCTKDLEGAYSLAVLDKKSPNALLGIKNGAPLVVGIGEEENFLASDPLALLQVTDRFIYLEDGDLVSLSQDDVKIQSVSGAKQKREIELYSHGLHSTEKGDYSHYMLKEIFEQPQAVENTLSGYITGGEFSADFLDKQAQEILDKTENLCIVGCGTSYHSALVAQHWFEEHLNINAKVEVASELLYKRRVIAPNTLYITISQSGETADILGTLNSINKSKQKLRSAKSGKNPVNDERNILASLAICNVPSSTLPRVSDISLITAAGPEIGVASTKAFVTQLAALLLLLGVFMQRRGEKEQRKRLAKELHRLPRNLEKILKLRDKIHSIATNLSDCKNAMFIGRGPLYPIAMEGALKLKEISYIHAEAYQGGELKHGPLALIDKSFPTIALLQKGKYFSKMKSNIQEVVAREGPVYVISDVEDKEIQKIAKEVVVLPAADPIVAPLFWTLPVQLLAYETAVLLGTNVDQPRNLAKSVTVE